MSKDLVPGGGPARWRIYGTRVIISGTQPVWGAFSVVMGVGLVAVGHFLLSIPALWILIAVLTALAMVLAVGGYHLWSEFERRTPIQLPPPAPQPAPSLLELLKAQLQSAYLLEGGVVVGETYEDHAKDPLWRWADETLGLLHGNEPVAARAFFGETLSYSLGDYLLVFFMDTQKVGRHPYLQRRIELLADLVQRVQARA